MLGKASGILERSRISGILVCGALDFLFFSSSVFCKVHRSGFAVVAQMNDG